MGWRSSSSIAVQVGLLLRSGQKFIYAYYDGVDKIAHERGFGEYYNAELRQADRLVADVLEQLTPGSVLIVTADHGQVHIGDASITPHRDVLDQVAYQSGEGRFRWLHARSGATQSLHATAQELYGDVAWVVTRDETIDNGWFGPRVTDVARKRLGDVALVDPDTDTLPDIEGDEDDDAVIVGAVDDDTLVEDDTVGVCEELPLTDSEELPELERVPDIEDDELGLNVPVTEGLSLDEVLIDPETVPEFDGDAEIVY
jgi:hypothetical protein